MSRDETMNCRFEQEMVSYLYGEFGQSERDVFESHLETCSSCVDQFAALSDARFSVFEWQREEFVPMETPAIEIPWNTPVGKPAPAGWLTGFVELFAFVRPPLAMAAGALVLFGIAIGSFVLLNGETEVASNRVPGVVEIEETIADENIATPEFAKDIEPRETERAPVPQAVKAPDGPRRATRPATTRNATPVSRPRSVPVLSEFRDVEDRSLRLADMLDDIGG